FLSTAAQPYNRHALMLGIFLSGALLCAGTSIVVGASWAGVWAIGIAMGISTIAANVCLFQGFAVGNPTVIALLSAMPPALVVLLAYVTWGEALTIGQIIAFVCILCGVLIVRSARRIRWTELQGAQWGVLALICFALTDMLGKMSTKLEAQTLPTLTVAFLTGVVFFAMRTALRRDAQRALGRAVRVGMVIGITNAVGMVCIVSAFALGITGLVSAIVATNALLIVLYTRIRGIERWHRNESIGMVCTLIGIVLLPILS
ncbi:MAG: DMT family transporter, partial [Paenibacillaceae bacterium]|nr:DMT family transporter [Paenibacillaceae bacterium]